MSSEEIFVFSSISMGVPSATLTAMAFTAAGACVGLTWIDKSKMRTRIQGRLMGIATSAKLRQRRFGVIHHSTYIVFLMYAGRKMPGYTIFTRGLAADLSIKRNRGSKDPRYPLAWVVREATEKYVADKWPPLAA